MIPRIVLTTRISTYHQMWTPFADSYPTSLENSAARATHTRSSAQMRLESGARRKKSSVDPRHLRNTPLNTDTGRHEEICPEPRIFVPNCHSSPCSADDQRGRRDHLRGFRTHQLS